MQTSDRYMQGLTLAVYYTTAGHVVRRDFNCNDITRHDADKMLAHSTGYMGQDLLGAFAHVGLNDKLGVGQGFNYFGFNLYGVCCQMIFLIKL